MFFDIQLFAWFLQKCNIINVQHFSWQIQLIPKHKQFENIAISKLENFKICGCRDLWVSESVSVGICECRNLWMSESMNVRFCWFDDFLFLRSIVFKTWQLKTVLFSTCILYKSVLFLKLCWHCCMFNMI